MGKDRTDVDYWKCDRAAAFHGTDGASDVTAADAALVLRVLVGLDTLSSAGAANAKVDGKATLSAEDAALILRYLVGLIDRFPVEA